MKTAIYAGSFDPPTYGHSSVIVKASKLFDRVTVLVADNPDKHPLFSAEDRATMVKLYLNGLNNVDCAIFGGFVVEYAKKHNAKFLIRGVRDATDFEYEAQMASVNKMLAPAVETFFVPADSKYAQVSSSGLKAMLAKGSDIDDYCHPQIAEQLKSRLFAQAPEEPKRNTCHDSKSSR
jgi:pantetheine-phosphate adenylyltransferase